MSAGYVKPSPRESWVVSILGAEGEIELHPSEMGAGWMLVSGRGGDETIDFSGSRDAFEAQADAFLASLSGENRCRNRPADAVGSC